MAHLGEFFRLLLVFPVVGFTNLYSCQVAAVNVFPQSADQNFTRSPTSLFTMRQQQQQRESPDLVPSMNHPWNNAVNAGSKNLRFLEMAPKSATPLAPFVDQDTVASLQQQLTTKEILQQRSINERVADSISYSVLRFGLEVGSQLTENAFYSKSEVFSPLSVMTALALLLAGAKGKSYQQLKPIFGFDLDAELQRAPNYAQLLHNEFGDLLQDIEQQDLKALHHHNNAKWRDTPVNYNIRGSPPNQNELVEHVIKVANGLFVQTGYSLNPNYRDVITTVYRSESSQLDFRTNNEAARQHINAWVSHNTYGKIPNIINNAIPESTNMILASVLYFKGFWENTFFEAATSLDNFYPEGEKKPAIKVQMMVTGGVFPFYDAQDLNCRIIGLPYKGNLSTMYIIQPKQSSRANLKSFQSKITAELIEDMISKMAYRTAVVAFPKMHVERQLNMKEILRHFGVTDIFSNSASDLSLIGGAANQNLQNVYKSAVKTVNHSPARPLQTGTQKYVDRFNEAPLFFTSRFGEIGTDIKINSTAKNTNANTNASNDTSSEKNRNETTTPQPRQETLTSESRKKRQSLINNSPISLLEAERLVSASVKTDLYVEDILHKVDFEVNEHGTEAAAATLTYLRRSGTDVIFRADTPFLLLIRHDPSKLILFYGIVNEPES